MWNTATPLHLIPWCELERTELKKTENSSQNNKGTHHTFTSSWNNILQSFDLQQMFKWNALASYAYWGPNILLE